MDAFFIGPLNCFDIGDAGMAPLLQKLNQWKVPTLRAMARNTSRQGALMGFSTWNFGPSGIALAGQAHAILTGTKPRAPPMLDQSEPSIALNLPPPRPLALIFPFGRSG